ncbi:MAG: hypothetical protein PUH38_07555 [Acidaminococcus fermentans]|uniref:hypothetical protein n=1 Tax=Acidaminococcus fermentans TaxID=905 RepID=UPI00242EDDF1|nr:hypothetical protein [Acidaminococcus fermentans]MCI6286839.1 hypothetical protein [Acidaminococcus fermentans]MDD7196303.1 hypothetical protein [Acidaminococcus fermentans]MDY2853510.1 hypothetical protein [Acidaminococcus fermentans]
MIFLVPWSLIDHGLGHEPGQDGCEDQEQENDGIGTEHFSLFLGLIRHGAFLLSAMAFLVIQPLSAAGYRKIIPWIFEFFELLHSFI